MPRIQITKPDGYLGNPLGSIHTVPDDDAAMLTQLGVAALVPESAEPSDPTDTTPTWKSFLTNVIHAGLTPEQRKTAIDLLPGTTGGHLVPATLDDDVLHALDDRSVIRPGATVLPMVSESLHVPAIDQSVAPTDGNTAQFAGFTLSWRGPTDTRAVLNADSPALADPEPGQRAEERQRAAHWGRRDFSFVLYPEETLRSFFR